MSTATPEPQPADGADWHLLLRLFGVLLGVALMAGVALGALIVVAGFFTTAQAPSPYVTDGFLCCPHPDTWAEVAVGSALTVAAVAGTVALFLVAVLLIVARPPTWRLFLTHSVGAGAVMMAAIFVSIGLQRGDTRIAPSCDGFVFDKAVFRTDDQSRAHQVMLLGVAKCGTFTGMTSKEVRALAGEPDSDPNGASHGVGHEEYDSLYVTYRDGRVEEAEVVVNPAPFD